MKIPLFSLLLGLASAMVASAEWRTESYALKPGWNAIYPTVDAGYTTLDTLLASYPDVQEIWRWQPERVDPRLPGEVNAPPVGMEWSIWKRGIPEETTFTTLNANYGYLVRLSDTAPQQSVAIKGRATLPEIRWRNDGLHLAGFPVVAAGTRPTFSSYLAPTGFSLGNAQVLRYNGGPIEANVNPASVVPSVSRIERGQAYWIRIEKFSRYYGPLKVELDTGGRVNFGTNGSSAKLLLTNQTTGTLSVTLDTPSSDSAPAGQPAVAGAVPLLAQVDAETQYAPLSNRTLTISSGSVMVVRLAVDRSAMGGAVGNHYASLLRLATTAGVAGEEVFLPVTAEVGSLAGLWIGEVQIERVSSVALRYERNAAGGTVYDSNGRPRIIEDLTTPGASTTLPRVANPYVLRVILHVDASRQATLLSHVYQGKLAAAPPEEPNGIVVRESLLDQADLKNATRLSVAHLPLDTELVLGGAFTNGATLTSAPLVTGYDDDDNPFVHRYHPDHDNLDARFASKLPTGKESFDIKRRLTFAFDLTAPEGASTSWGTTLTTGTYSEIIEGPYKTPIRVAGPISLYKVSDIPVITRN